MLFRFENILGLLPLSYFPKQKVGTADNTATEQHQKAELIGEESLNSALIK